MSDQVESVVLAERQTIELPSIGDYKDAPVVELLARPGDMIAVDDPLIVLESDKATIEVPSPVSGRLVEMLVDVGMRLSEGSPFAVVEGLAASKPAPAAPEPEVPATTEAPAKAMAPTAPPPPAAAPSPGEANPVLGAVHASPSVRALARELGVSLAEVPPSGRKGRILRDDVFGLVKRRLAQPSGGLSVPEMPVVDFARFGAVERVPLSRIQQISGSSLHRNWVTIPHVTNFDEADVSDIETFRVGVNAERREPPVKLTMLAFLAKASAIALKQHPRFNASLDGDALVLKKYVHIGVAVDTPRGLLVPVVRDCDSKGIIEIGAEIAALAEKARAGKLAPSDMEGGCFSISSLGGIGGTGFTPIINAPEVAILGAARARMQQQWGGSDFRPRLIMPISLSWDHRVVDGVAAARFLGTIASILGDFRRAVL